MSFIEKTHGDIVNLQHLSVSNPAIRERPIHCNTTLNEAYDSITAATGIHTNIAYESLRGVKPKGLPHERGLQTNVAYDSITGLRADPVYDTITGTQDNVPTDTRQYNERVYNVITN